jgi:hypothetical protein
VASNQITMDKRFSSCIAKMADEVNQDSGTTSLTQRVGTFELGDGRVGQVHVTLTTIEEDFLEVVCE